jgi:hypothetical protein
MTSASTTQSSASPSETPRLADLFPVPAQARTLERFIGTWSISGTLEVAGSRLGMTGEWRFAPAAAAWGVKATLSAAIEGMGAYEEDDLFGFDVETGTFHIYSLTNSGAVHDHPARWSSADVMEFSYDGLQGGKSYRETGRTEFLGADRIRVESTDYVDGALSTAMIVVLERRS